MNPKVFISHASEDKSRFVVDFATKLRSNGVDAWLDKWEMLPGDSLVDKIFEEGLKDAEAVIIVLSSFSVKKPWIREELNASIVGRISRGTKIIPILLDQCEVPESLTSTLWEPIKNLDSYDDSFQRILSSIFGVLDKPALGSTPLHTKSVYHEIGGLTKADNIVLKESCETLIQNKENTIEPEKVFSDGSKFGFSREEIKDCIDVLEHNGYIEVSRYFGSGNDSYNLHFGVTTYGFENYARAYINNYEETIGKTISAIVNENICTNDGLASKTEQPVIIINHILDTLENNNHINIVKTIGGRIEIYKVAASLRRILA